MKILYFDCGMGAAGDMLTGALVSLLTREEQESFISEINSIGLKDVTVSLTDDVKCGITGSHVRVVAAGHEEMSCDVHEHHAHEHDEHHPEHEHAHHDEHHHHEHHHASMADIEHIISHLNVSDKVKSDILSIYKIVAEAESKVHGKSVSEIHFHEVGMMDALADISGVCMLMEKISPDRVICSPINVGFGKVKCAHGILPVPAPATAEILTEIPIYAGRFEGEMCTPTGAALLKYFADEFSYMPLMVTEKTGYGCGNKYFDAANVVKAVIGKDNLSKDLVIELKCNVDDMTGEELAYAVDVILAAGARDAFTTPVNMKKGRSGHLLTVLCDIGNKEKIAKIIFEHTSTIGIRECVMERMVLDRSFETVSTEYGDIRVKVSSGYGVKKIKPEFDDLKAASEKYGKSIAEIREVTHDTYSTRLL